MAERSRQVIEYKNQYAHRKIPKRILEWNPTSTCEHPRPYDEECHISDDEVRLGKKFKLDFDQVAALFPDDFTLVELLSFEKTYLGYYLHSPLDAFNHRDDTDIDSAKSSGVLECVIEERFSRNGANGEYFILNVTDGIDTARVNVWGNEINLNDEVVFEVGTGVQMNVVWKDQYKSFSLKSRSFILPLELKEHGSVSDGEFSELMDLLENINEFEGVTNESK